MGEKLAVHHISGSGPVTLAVARDALAVAGPGILGLKQPGLLARIGPLEGVKGLAGKELELLPRCQRRQVPQASNITSRDHAQDVLVALLGGAGNIRDGCRRRLR